MTLFPALFNFGRALISAIAAVLLIVLALWIWSRAETLAAAVASTVASAVTSATPISGGAAFSTPPARLVQAVQAIAIATGAGAQALLLREVVPMFYARRWIDEALHVMASMVVVAGLLAGIVLLVETT